MLPVCPLRAAAPPASDQSPRNGPRLGGGKGSGDLQGLRGDQEQGVALQGGVSGALKVGGGYARWDPGWLAAAAPCAFPPALPHRQVSGLHWSSETKCFPVPSLRPRGVQVCTPEQDRSLPRAVLRRRATDPPFPDRASAKSRPCAHWGACWPALSQVIWCARHHIGSDLAPWALQRRRCRPRGSG